MPDSVTILLDQNIPYPVLAWFQQHYPQYSVFHTRDIGLRTALDDQLYQWAIQKQAFIITFDEDFARLSFQTTTTRPGIIRLKVVPTSSVMAVQALTRLLTASSFEQLLGCLVIVDSQRGSHSNTSVKTACSNKSRAGRV